ncbi:hypothetical protein MJO28_009577 [Puccinia striiformis f. sp. tritici]|uniref:Uncharacterized protein n=1 Tax=Puccinia striiformis f. sp. tritici TaxID=168172 RepID=A0ACC0E7M9_9BASI|nr:hypothetical protein MJO28_009577 [Puccinia striiformis f. sp. tritici]
MEFGWRGQGSEHPSTIINPSAEVAQTLLPPISNEPLAIGCPELVDNVHFWFAFPSLVVRISGLKPLYLPHKFKRSFAALPLRIRAVSLPSGRWKLA